MESSPADSDPTETKTVIILLLLNSFDFAVVAAVVDDKSSETSEKIISKFEKQFDCKKLSLSFRRKAMIAVL